MSDPEIFTFTRAEVEAHERLVEQLQERIRSLEATNRALRRDLADPPGDVQEAVLRKLKIGPFA